MKRLVLIAVASVASFVATNAIAQAPAQEPGFNPFATFSLGRFTFNTLGFLQVEPTNPFSTLPATGTSTPAVGGGGAGLEEEVALAVVPRPPYRPPVRSPYRPPPRPPF
jgi:hypothetical protein